MKKLLAAVCLFVFLSGLSGVLAAETQYEEFAFPETLSVEEYEKKINDLYYTKNGQELHFSNFRIML